MNEQGSTKSVISLFFGSDSVFDLIFDLGSEFSWEWFRGANQGLRFVGWCRDMICPHPFSPSWFKERFPEGPREDWFDSWFDLVESGADWFAMCFRAVQAAAIWFAAWFDLSHWNRFRFFVISKAPLVDFRIDSPSSVSWRTISPNLLAFRLWFDLVIWFRECVICSFDLGRRNQTSGRFLMSIAPLGWRVIRFWFDSLACLIGRQIKRQITKTKITTDR